MSSAEAVQYAARVADLILVRNGDDVMLYRTRRGALVSARIKGPLGSFIGPGGAGFDDRLDEWELDK